MKEHSIEDQNILIERKNFLLSLRKNKINFKLFERRNLALVNDKKIINIFDENNNIKIADIKSKFNDLLLIEDTNEEKFLNILCDLLNNFSKFIESNKIKNINEEIIESAVIEKIYSILIIKGYINNEEILTIILIIVSIEIFIYNHLSKLKLYKQKYIANEKYINLISSLLKIDNEKIAYHTYKLIALLSTGSKDIFHKLNEYKILEQIIKKNEFVKKLDLIKIKLYCISKFKLEFEHEKNLSLEIQNLYIGIFKEYILDNNFDNELLVYFVKVIKNLSFCVNDVYLKNLLDSKIISFLLDFDEINKTITKDLLKIIGNMSSTLNEEIYLKLYLEVLQYLIDIILNITNNNSIIGLALWNINNFCVNKNLCFDIFFEQNLILIYKNYILENDIIDENVFNEICLSLHNLLLSINQFEKYYLVREHNLIILIITAFQKIKTFNNIYKTGKNIIELILLLFMIKDKEVSLYNKFCFEINGGNECIFDKIEFLLLEQNKNNQNITLEKNKNNEDELLEYMEALKKIILNDE